MPWTSAGSDGGEAAPLGSVSATSRDFVGPSGGTWVKLMSEEHQQCLVRNRAEPTLGQVEQGWMSECTGAPPAWPWLPLEGVEAGGAPGWILYFPSLFFTFIPSAGRVPWQE